MKRRRSNKLQLINTVGLAGVEETETTLVVNFGEHNPNDELIEIHAREKLFFPKKAGVNYITVRGFHFLHAAPNWQAPNIADDSIGDPGRVTQIGAIGASMCKGWVIEDNEVMYSKTAGIMLGEHIDYSGSQYQDVSLFGHHVVRNNVIHHCGQFGVAGQKGISKSIIEGNLIQDINIRDEFGGFEPAGIKIWNNVDVTIENNLIRRCHATIGGFGIWIDFGNTNTRITRNIIYDTTDGATLH